MWGLIRKRLVELRLDFLASPSLVDIPPVFEFCAVVAPGLVNSGSLVTEKWPPSVSLGFTAISSAAAP